MPTLSALQELPWDDWHFHEETYQTVSDLVYVARTLAYGSCKVYEDNDKCVILDRIERNPDCFIISTRNDGELTLRLHLDHGVETIFLGPVIGLSTIFPMNYAALIRYLSGEFGLNSWATDAILPDTARIPHMAHTTVISRCIYFPEIDEPGTFARSGRSPTSNGERVFLDLGRRIASMMPKVGWHEATGTPVWLSDDDIVGPRPLIICPLSHRFKGGQFTKRLGFTSQINGVVDCSDADGFEVHSADFSQYITSPHAVQSGLLILAKKLCDLA